VSVYVALLRGINVGGNKLVAMSDLRALAEAEGFAEATTLLQSGNLVFRGAKRATAAIEKTLETAARKRLGLDIDFMVRSDAEWAAIVGGNPFHREAKADPSRLVVVCLKTVPAASAVEALAAAIPGRESMRAQGRELYVYYPDGIGASKLPAIIDRKLGVRGTARNWNTVLKLAHLLETLGSAEAAP
jgi:uncharacterized protein (DUF1697 family)